MKIKVRNGLFETNSSSMHSLVIKKDSVYANIEVIKSRYLEEDGVLDCGWWNEDDLVFGRTPFKFLHTFEKKLAYLIASNARLLQEQGSNGEVANKILEAVCNKIPECKEIKFPQTCPHWGEEDFVPKDTYGGVDEDILTPFLAENNITMAEFLFNRKYSVVVDGDEYCIFEDMFNSGLIDVDELEKIYGGIEYNEPSR